MRSKLFNISIAFIVIIIAISSCNRVEEPNPLNKQDAIDLLNEMGSTVEQIKLEIQQSKGVLALNYLNEIFVFEEDTTEEKRQLFEAIPVLFPDIIFFEATNIMEIPPRFRLENSNGLDTLKGTFTWIHLTESWDHLPEPEDKLVVIFPSTSTLEDNNASLTIWNHNIMVYEDTAYLASMNASLLIESEDEATSNEEDSEVLYIEYYTTAVEGNALETISLSLELFPFTFSLTTDFTQSGNDLAVAHWHEVKKDVDKLISSSIEMFFKGITSISPFDSTNASSNISTLMGYIQIGQVKVKLDMVLEAFISAIDAQSTPAEITSIANNHLKTPLFTFPLGSKIADTKWVWDSEEEFVVPYLVFNDGSEASASEFFYEFINLDLK